MRTLPSPLRPATALRAGVPCLLLSLLLVACGAPVSDAALVAPVPVTTAPAPRAPITAPDPVTGAAANVMRAAQDASTRTTTATPAPLTGTSGPAPTTRSRAGGSTTTGGATIGPAGTQKSAKITFYAAFDNDPAGSTQIAYPSVHSEAGGTGTFSDPVTMASDADQIAPGTVIYYPPLKKYFVMEDQCASCLGSGSFWIDLYAGGATDSGVEDCEAALTPGGNVTIEINPPAGRPVDTTPLYANGRCISG
ncbi:MAG: hypothetical protein OJJ54_03870 [Pseudonocardia sp.]|nr:hypothetical protein [Pseudonocardia sp.]